MWAARCSRAVIFSGNTRQLVWCALAPACTRLPCSRGVATSAELSTAAEPITGAPQRIMTYPAPILREKAAVVVDARGPECRQLVANMRATLAALEDGALGLAAPQIGVSARVFILQRPRFKNEGEYSSFMRQWRGGRGRQSLGRKTSSSVGTDGPERPNEGKTFIAIINPSIIKKSEASDMNIEGCLSLPDVPPLVRRAQRIDVEYTDEEGAVHRELWQGLPAVAFQHEMDHLDGVLAIDREVQTFVARSRDQEMEEAAERGMLEYMKFFEGPEGQGHIRRLAPVTTE